MPFVKGVRPPRKKPAQPVPHFERYGVYWAEGTTELEIEMTCYRQGGAWIGPRFVRCGAGLIHHFKRIKSLLWPQIVWHKWNILEMECFLKYRIVGELGPASSGKSHSGATNFLTDYWCWPECTTVIVSSTTRESLEMRVWGEMKSYFRDARTRIPWLAGNLIEGRQRIVTDDRSEAVEGRDFRNGIVGIACKKGQNYQGLGEYVGIKNKRVRLLADELQFMPKDFISAISNLNKNDDFKAGGYGNPKETLDALGVLCEPAAHLGGWDGGIDQQPGTKTWQIRFDQGIAIQLPGSDSPNLDGKLGIPLISQAHIDSDVAFWGKNSIQYTMMNEGRMPRGQGSRRILTRTLCTKFKALDEVIWKDNQQVKVGFLDAAYRGVGGDRCIFGEMRYGVDVEGIDVLALIETMVVPIVDDSKVDPEDQIAEFTKQQCLMRGIPAKHFGFDSTGRGSLMAAYARIWDPYVTAIEFGGSASERVIKQDDDGKKILACDYYANRVTEFWYTWRLIVEAGQFRGLSDDGMQEGCSREWGFVGRNKIQVEPKDKMKLKTGRSPDVADGIVTGCEMAQRLGFKIASLSPDGGGHREEAWKRELRQQSEQLWHAEALHY